MPNRPGPGLLALGSTLLCFGTAAAAQGPVERCTLEVETAPGTETRAVGVGGEDYRIHIRGEVEATCGPSRVRADSALYFESRGELYLYSNVRYRSGSRTLESDRATYFADEDRVRAEGNVRLMDEAGGSTLTGPVVHYYPATEARPRERIFAPERPHLVVRGAEDEPPFDIDADRVHMYGDSIVAAAGRAVGVQTDLTANADSMHLDRGADRLWLVGEPVVESRGTVLAGDTMLVMIEEQRVEEIRAWPNASATGEELSLEAPSIRIFIEEDAIQRVVAASGRRTATTGPETPADTTERAGALDGPDVTGATPGTERDTTLPGPEEAAPSGAESETPRRARSESSDYVLEADSIDVLRPAGRLDRVVAVGGARAVSRMVVVPGDSLLGRDWIEGDTITAYFEDPSAADGEPEMTADGDTGTARTEGMRGNAGGRSDPADDGPQLRRLVASGNARALYYVREEEPTADPERPPINYVIGKVITIWLEGGEAQDVKVTGPGTGVYLEPLRPGEAPDTTAVDTVPPGAVPTDTFPGDTLPADTLQSDTVSGRAGRSARR